MIKKILNFLIFFLSFFFLFLVSDFFISKYTNLFHVKKDCFKYLKLQIDNKDYYSYELEKNCFAIEHKSVAPSYNVFTNNLGNRVAKHQVKKINKKEKIIFLGDSFTYGFGLDYEDSIPGKIDKKTKENYEIVNFAMPGYSPSMNLFKLNKYLKKTKNLKIEKVFYILDLTDVHDESNRWLNVGNSNMPVIIDESIENEIKETFDARENFRTTRFLSYLINKNVRNLRKKINNYFLPPDSKNLIGSGTYWGKFTHTSHSKLKEDKEYNNLWPNDFELGLQNIKIKLKEISDVLKPYDTELYIVIHPWRETLELGQAELNWEEFAGEVCVLSGCKKVISLFDEVRKIKNLNTFWKTEIYFPNDVHFNKKGNDLYFKHIYSEAFK
ncbi:hypothetical protein OAL70_03815 [Pelagibacteraceae bacterium]|nr:hypothetical protein [Pelagibacteraceae bacterium]